MCLEYTQAHPHPHPHHPHHSKIPIFVGCRRLSSVVVGSLVDCQTTEDVRGGEAASLVADESHSIHAPVQEPPLLSPGSAQELRLARLYANTYPLDTNAARAAIYGEEHPHLTVHQALHQVGAARP